MDLLQRQPPAVIDRTVGPNTALDHLILDTMNAREPMWWTAAEIVRATQAPAPDVWRRLGILTKRGVLARRQPWDAPRRGPGSHQYSVTRPTEYGTADES